LKESDLYAPVKVFLEQQGCEVKGEVAEFDILAVRNGLLFAVELKSTVTLKLLMQAASRLASVDAVYIAVPTTSPVLRTQRRNFTKLLRLLGIGLLEVGRDGRRVDPVLDPGEYRPRKRTDRRGRLLKEHAELVGDPNTGGGTRRGGIMTPYRQRALAVASYLGSKGPSRVRDVRDAVSEPDALQIMYRNVYGWFERISTGVYGLSPKGAADLPLWSRGPEERDR
jgi:hypothetical protein